VKLPSLSEFTRLTADLAFEDGFGDYLPTYVVGDEIHVIEDIPEDASDLEVLLVALRDLEGREFLFAVSTAAGEITTGHVGGDSEAFMLISERDGGEPQVADLARPAWWGSAH
jgi:hypothetical protein